MCRIIIYRSFKYYLSRPVNYYVVCTGHRSGENVGSIYAHRWKFWGPQQTPMQKAPIVKWPEL